MQELRRRGLARHGVDHVGAIARPDYWAHVRSFLEENGL
jgi:hypothetical protein